MSRIVFLLIVGLAGCASAPEQAPAPARAPAPMDGGIVGTGNRIDCEPRTAKAGGPLPEECARDREPRR